MTKVLIIEPDKPLADLYEQALNSAGHTAITAHTAQSAIFAVDEYAPDMIFLELQLAAHSGIEFLYELRTYPEWQDIPVIILSSLPPGELQASYHILRDQLNVKNYYYKPQTSLRQIIDIVGDTISV